MNIRLFCLLVCVSLLTGCTAIHTEEQLMVVVMAIDCHENRQITVTVKVPSFSAPAEGGGADSYITLTASGADLAAALTHLASAAPRSLNFSQTRQVLIHQDALQQDPLLITVISKIEGMRSQAMISVCQSKAGELLNMMNPSIGTRLSRYIDSTLDTALKEGIIPDSTMIRSLSHISSGYQDALLSVLTKSSGQTSASSGEQPSSNDEKSKTIKTELSWSGAAAMDGQALSGYLTSLETTLCRFIRSEISTITYSTDEGVYRLTSRIGPHFSVDQSASHHVLHIHGTINMYPLYDARPDPESVARSLEQDTENLLRKLQALQCDAFGYGGQYSKRFFTLRDWEQSNWKEQYIRANLDIHFNMTLMDE